jgi:ArsR family transcriptional regulator
MPNDEMITGVASFFSVVGDMTRCKILFALKESEMCVCDLANVLSMTKSSISHQLNKLKAAGFVKCEKVGKQVFYSLDDEHIWDIFDISLVHLQHREMDNEK